MQMQRNILHCCSWLMGIYLLSLNPAIARQHRCPSNSCTNIQPLSRISYGVRVREEGMSDLMQRAEASQL